jgi:hypothetical protein
MRDKTRESLKNGLLRLWWDCPPDKLAAWADKHSLIIAEVFGDAAEKLGCHPYDLLVETAEYSDIAYEYRS